MANALGEKQDYDFGFFFGFFCHRPQVQNHSSCCESLALHSVVASRQPIGGFAINQPGDSIQSPDWLCAQDCGNATGFLSFRKAILSVTFSVVCGYCVFLVLLFHFIVGPIKEEVKVPRANGNEPFALWGGEQLNAGTQAVVSHRLELAPRCN